MKSVLFACLLLLFASANAQSKDLNYGNLSRNDWSSIMRGNQPLQTRKSDNVELKGSPFIFATYEKGVIIVSDSIRSEGDFKLKFNAEDNEIWIFNDKKEELALTDKRITGFELIFPNDTHVYKKVLLPDVKIAPNRFVEVLFNGKKFVLIKNTEKIFEAANGVDKGVAIVGRNYDSYTTVTTYYVLNAKKVFRRISLKKGDIYKADVALVEANKDAINAFIKAEKITNPLEEDDAIDLLDFIDKLK
jgi:hypothetical protein